MEKRKELREKLYEYRKNSPVEIETSTRREQSIIKTLEDKNLTEADLLNLGADGIDEIIQEINDRIEEQNELAGDW